MNTIRPHIRRKLLSAGVRNLKEFGYPAVTAENITADYVFRAMFKSMLDENKGMGCDPEIEELLAEIKANVEKETVK